jgi:hypothetical protein
MISTRWKHVKWFVCNMKLSNENRLEADFQQYHPIWINEGVLPNGVLPSASEITISIQAEYLRQSGRVPSQPSEALHWCISPRQASTLRVTLQIALRSLFTVSSRAVSLLFEINTLALWGTVTILRDGFTGYALESALQCDG